MPSTTLALDPVCGMTVDASTALAVEYAGTTYHFCEPACADIFRDDPERWIELDDADRWATDR